MLSKNLISHYQIGLYPLVDRVMLNKIILEYRENFILDFFACILFIRVPVFGQNLSLQKEFNKIKQI